MKTFEVKGFWGFLLFSIVSILLVSAVVTLPISFTWVAWNAIVGEAFNGPLIEFWQAIILTAAIGVAFKIIFQPQISIQVKRVKSPDELRNLKNQGSTKD